MSALLLRALRSPARVVEAITSSGSCLRSLSLLAPEQASSPNRRLPAVVGDHAVAARAVVPAAGPVPVTDHALFSDPGFSSTRSRRLQRRICRCWACGHVRPRVLDGVRPNSSSPVFRCGDDPCLRLPHAPPGLSVASCANLVGRFHSPIRATLGTVLARGMSCGRQIQMNCSPHTI